MKTSEQLQHQASKEDNDFRSLALLTKALRENRSERFIEDWLPVFMRMYPVEARLNGSYSITTQKFGTIDYFPKANKVLIRKTNKWIKPGLKWLISNLTL